MLIAAAASFVPAKGDPWFGRGRRATRDGHAQDTLEVEPAGATLGIAGADVGEPVQPARAPESNVTNAAPATSTGARNGDGPGS
jgi:hypothetical protein